MGERLLVIAIDGPAGSGKSTVARAVAARLGLAVLDTGAMYRAVTWAALRRGIAPSDGAALGELAEGLNIELEGASVRLDGIDVGREIRAEEVSSAVSAVAAHPEVRRPLVAAQRRWATARGGGVAEGRDMGTVVFPDAALKVHLVASSDVRARRRAAEQDRPDADQVAEALAVRDHLDSTRAHAPLRMAPDSIVIDTSELTIDAVVERVVQALHDGTAR